MRRLKIHIVFLFTIFNILVCNTIFSQVAIVINKNVGVFIDSLENYKYLLFTDYSFDDFIGAQVVKNNDNSHKLLIYLKSDQKITKEINEDVIKKISDRIDIFINDYQ
ncbi:MAG: hypothetical protein AB7S50_11955 [Bacteroidales bacterium]